MSNTLGREKGATLGPAEVSSLIHREIGNRWDRTNAHGVDLGRCLVLPEKRTYVLDGGESDEFWLVLEEDPVGHSGYQIVFDEELGLFGLAMANLDGHPDLVIGLYGTFLQTLEAM